MGDTRVRRCDNGGWLATKKGADRLGSDAGFTSKIRKREASAKLSTPVAVSAEPTVSLGKSAETMRLCRHNRIYKPVNPLASGKNLQGTPQSHKNRDTQLIHHASRHSISGVHSPQQSSGQCITQHRLTLGIQKMFGSLFEKQGGRGWKVFIGIVENQQQGNFG